jgi:DNA-directed RNA polymerase specialized sigma24 family protein
VIVEATKGQRVAAAPAFDAMVRAARPRLLHALMAHYGPDLGCEATDAALAWAWEHQDRMRSDTDPVPYLFRVAQSKARPGVRWRRRRADYFATDRLFAVDDAPFDAELLNALRKLPPDHRAAVLLVYGYGWTAAEVAVLRDVPLTTITNHLHRGLRRLRELIPKEEP